MVQNVLAMRALLGYQIWIKIYQRAGERHEQIIHRSNFYHNVPMKFVLQDMNNSLIPKADLSPWQQQVCSGNIQCNVSFEQQRAEVLRTENRLQELGPIWIWCEETYMLQNYAFVVFMMLQWKLYTLRCLDAKATWHFNCLVKQQHRGVIRRNTIRGINYSDTAGWHTC